MKTTKSNTPLLASPRTSLSLSARNQVEHVQQQILRNEEQIRKLKHMQNADTYRDWDKFYQDFVTTSHLRNFEPSIIPEPPVNTKTMMRTKILKQLLKLNKTEEWYNLTPEIQSIFRFLDTQKHHILSQESLDEEYFSLLSRHVGSDLESKTTRGLVDSFFDSLDDSFKTHGNLPNHPQMGFLPDFMNLKGMLGDFSADLKQSLPDKNLIDKLTSALASLTQNVDSKFANFSWFIPMIGSIVGGTNFVVSGCKTSLTLSLVCSIYLLFFHWDKIGQPLIDVFWNFYSRFLSQIKESVDMEMEVVPQMSTDNILDAAVMALSGIFNFIIPGATTATTFSFLASYARGRNGLLPMMKSCLSVLEVVVNKAMANFEGWKYYSFIKTNHFEMDEWLSEVRDIISRFNNNKLLRTSLNTILLDDLVSRGDKLFKNMPRTQESNNLCTIIMKDMSELKKILASYRKGSKAGSRVETTGVLIRGGPGVHKTIVLQALAKTLALSELPKELQESFDQNTEKYVHYRVPGAKYEDGMSDTVTVQCIDDYAQAVDVPGDSNEFIHTIHACSPFPYNLPMADLADKGAVYYKALYMLCTSNAVSLKAESIISTSALLRRFPIDCIQTIKKEYCTAETADLDIWHRKISHSEKVHGIDFNVFEFHVGREEPSGWKTTKIVDYHELLHMIMIQCRLRKQHWEVNTKTIDNLSSLFAFPQSADREDEVDRFVSYVLEEFEVPTSNIRMDLYHLMISDYSGKEVFYGSPRDYIYHLVECYGFEETKAFFDASEEEGDDKGRAMNFLSTGRQRTVDLECLKPTFYQTFMSYLESFFRDSKFWGLYLLSKTPQILTLITGVSVLAFIVGPYLKHALRFIAGIFGWSSAMPQKEEFSEPQSFSISDRLKTPVQRTVVQSNGLSDKLKSPPVTRTALPQMGCTDDPTAFDVANSSYFGNSFLMTYKSPDDLTWTKGGHVFFVKNTLGLMPFHYFTTFKEYSHYEENFSKGSVRFTKPDKNEHSFTCSISEFLSCCKEAEFARSNDLIMFQLPKTFQRVKDITSSFYLEKDFTFISRNLPVLVNFNVDGRNISYSSNGHLMMEPLSVNGLQLKPQGEILPYQVARAFCVKLQTTKGDCGVVYTGVNRATEGRKLFAMHVSGNTSVGFGALITQEFLGRYYSLFPEDTIRITPDLPKTTPQIDHERMTYIGNLSPAPSHSTRSTIIPSVFYGKLEPVETAPSTLRPIRFSDGTMLDPWRNAMTNYCQPPPEIDSEALDAAVENLRVFLLENSRFKVSHRVLTLEEALEGIESEIDFVALKGSTSPGYPMNLSGDANLKKKLFSFEKGSAERLACIEELRVLVEDSIERLNKGILDFFPCVDNLKDERRSLSKVAEAKTRMFSGTPFVYLVICRMYFGSYLLEIHKNRIHNGMGIGVRVYSGEWNHIAQELKTHLVDDDDLGIGAGDYKAFDGSQNPTVMWKILDVIQDSYKDDSFHIRSLLWENMVFSHHIVKGQVYLWNGSLPSGHLCTALVNCMTNLINFRYCWLKAGLDINEFSKNVKVFVMGDDNVFSVAPLYRGSFNEMSLGPLMKLIGMTYTTEIKGEATVPFRKITDVEFLKRRFVFDPMTNEFVAPLRLSVVLDMPNWTRSGGMRNVIAADNLSNAHKELSLHEKEVFDRYHPKLIRLKEDILPEVNLSYSIYNNYFNTRKEVRASDAHF